MTFAAAPEALQGAVAAGINGAGSVILGAAENAGELLVRGVTEMEENGECAAEATEQIAGELRAARKPAPGFGHLLHKPDDPRSHAPARVGDMNAVLSAATPLSSKHCHPPSTLRGNDICLPTSTAR